MTNKIFVDSSVLIEPLQNRKVEFYKNLVLNHISECCVNSIVLSEYLYKYIGLQNLGSPRQIQSDKKIAEALQPYLFSEILKEFIFVEPDNSVVSLVPSLMAKYNLLPNDAVILATCKIYNITQLASHDKDFKTPCEIENITLLTED